MQQARVVVILSFSVTLMTAACAGTRPIGPDHVYVPSAREQRLWEQSRVYAAELIASGQMRDDPALHDYLGVVLKNLLGDDPGSYSPLKPAIHVIDSPTVNAFALPHGEIFVHAGLLGRLRNEAQLAMLLGHELTHATHRHADQRMEHLYARTAAHSYVTLLSAIGGAAVHNVTTALSALSTQAAVSGYSRTKEQEADRVGLLLMARAGYDPAQGAEMFQQMLDAAERKRRRWNFLYATHPKMKDRVRSCRQLLGRLDAQPDVREPALHEDRYLQHAADLILQEAERHVAQGKYDLAHETVTFLEQHFPADARPAALSGDLYRARAAEGDLAKAEQSYRQALERDASCARARRGLGFCSLKNGDHSAARQNFSAYLQLAPEAEDAAFVRQYLDRLSRETR